MKVLKVLLILCIPVFLWGQKYIDTLYTIETLKDIEYGKSIDFAGNERTLLFDISFPDNDTLDVCGRPLVLFIHGGAFVTGSKDDYSPSRFRQDFAKRGFAAASINYRLGQFQTEKNIHCNISGFGLDWDCTNMADTSEWYRAYFRGVQDINSCIRYMVNHAEELEIDPQNIFLIGESAGGYLAMGAGFIDDNSEVLSELVKELPDVYAPNAIYEAPCIQHPNYNLDTSIASMDLERPDLGSFSGDLNWPLQSGYTIKGVANFFGGAFNNIFTSFSPNIPALYLFHQPNDLIVPFGYNKILQGTSVCASGFPFNCQPIINRPFSYGSGAIVELIDELALNGDDVPEYMFENSGNTANCALQILDPTLQGHSIDNYWLRTNNAAAFFAPYISECVNTSTNPVFTSENIFTLRPNPSKQMQTLFISGPFQGGEKIELIDVTGRVIYQAQNNERCDMYKFEPNDLKIPSGFYLINIRSSALRIHNIVKVNVQ